MRRRRIDGGRYAAAALCGCGLLATLLAATVSAAPAAAFADPQSPGVGAWEYLQPQLYGDRPIGYVDEKFMSMQAPTNTQDPAMTPVSLRFGPGAVGNIKQIRVIIDNNPIPLAATFNLAPGAPIAAIDLRVRIDRFTSVRAIAETTTGRLEMRSVWVQASGGCSAASGAASAGKPGEIRFRPSPDDKSLQVSIRHPNNSGFQIDPRTGNPIRQFYITHIGLRAGGQPLLEADTGVSIAENPTLRIVADRRLPTPVTVAAIDSDGGHYAATWDGTSSHGDVAANGAAGAARAP